MNSWVLPSFLSLLLYGIWGFLGAKASPMMNAKAMFVLSCVGSMIIGLIATPFSPSLFEFSRAGISLSLLQGMATGIGTLFFIYALQRGPAIPIVMITALYPIVTVLLSLCFLKSGLTLKQGFGIIFSMVAIYFLTIP